MIPQIPADTKWDESVKRILKFCRELAADIGGNNVGTEHLLLALVSETPTDEHGIEILHFEAVLSIVRWIYDPPHVNPYPCDTPRFKLALGRAALRACAESRPVSRRDLWHGLLADPDSFCNQVLCSLRVEERTRKLLG